MPGPAFGRVVTPQLAPVNKQRANVTPDKIAQDNAIERINGFLVLFSPQRSLPHIASIHCPRTRGMLWLKESWLFKSPPSTLSPSSI